MKIFVRLSLAVFLTVSCLACGGIHIGGTKSAEQYIEKQDARRNRHYQTMHKFFDLPDDYTSIISNPMIDRPIFVPQSTDEGCKSDVSSVMKSDGAQAMHQRELSKMLRNKTIQRLFAGKIFRQVLPQDDPTDPAIPPDALVLETTCETNDPKNVTSVWMLRDNLTNKSVVVKGREEITGLPAWGVSRYFIDSVLLDSIKHNWTNADFEDQYRSWQDSCMDRVLAKMVAEYKR
jgi:hypothetical protein